MIWIQCPWCQHILAVQTIHALDRLSDGQDWVPLGLYKGARSRGACYVFGRGARERLSLQSQMKHWKGGDKFLGPSCWRSQLGRSGWSGYRVLLWLSRGPHILPSHLTKGKSTTFYSNKIEPLTNISWSVTEMSALASSLTEAGRSRMGFIMGPWTTWNGIEP